MSSSRVFRCSQALMAAAKAAKASAAATSSGVPATKTVPSSPKGILKVTPVSPAMRKFLGASESSRTDAVKKIWEYIKLHNLQNPANKKEIRCDEKLKTIFDGKDTVGFLEIGKLLSPHFVKTN